MSVKDKALKKLRTVPEGHGLEEVAGIRRRVRTTPANKVHRRAHQHFSCRVGRPHRGVTRCVGGSRATDRGTVRTRCCWHQRVVSSSRIERKSADNIQSRQGGAEEYHPSPATTLSGLELVPVEIEELQKMQGSKGQRARETARKERIRRARAKGKGDKGKKVDRVCFYGWKQGHHQSACRKIKRDEEQACHKLAAAPQGR